MRKGIVFALLAVLIASITVPIFAATVEDFTDVPEGIWFHEYVEFAAEKGLVSGTSATTFSPDETMTRADFVTVLGRFAGADTSKTSVSFIDVPDNYYYTPYIYWAASNGIVTGTYCDTFDPYMPISKEQVATVLCRYAESMDKRLNLPDWILPPLGDDAKISDYAKVNVNYLYYLGIVTGNEKGFFEPQKNISRAEATTLLVKFIQKHDFSGNDPDR